MCPVPLHIRGASIVVFQDQILNYAYIYGGDCQNFLPIGVIIKKNL